MLKAAILLFAHPSFMLKNLFYSRRFPEKKPRFISSLPPPPPARLGLPDIKVLLLFVLSFFHPMNG
jgi:hypothetical protein